MTELAPFTLHMEIFQDGDAWAVVLRSNYLGSTLPRRFATYEAALSWLMLELTKIRPYVRLASDIAGGEVPPQE